MSRYTKFLKRKWAEWSFSKSGVIYPEEAIVTFTFDDAPASAFENGGNILAGKSMKGTFYIAMSLLNNGKPDSEFKPIHLEQAQKQGHELGCHTYGHIDLSLTPYVEAINDIQHNQEVLQRWMPGLIFKNFSYPYGAQTRAAKVHMSKRFRSARGIGHGVNIGKIDLANLKTVKLYENKYPLDWVFQQLDQAIDQKAWIIFYTHDVQTHYSDYGCSPTYFRAVVEACAQQKLIVKTVDGALDALGLV